MIHKKSSYKKAKDQKSLKDKPHFINQTWKSRKQMTLKKFLMLNFRSIQVISLDCYIFLLCAEVHNNIFYHLDVDFLLCII